MAAKTIRQCWSKDRIIDYMDRNKSMLIRRLQHKAAGLCTECFNKVETGFSRCASCRKKNNSASVSYRKTFKGRYSHFKVVAKSRGLEAHLTFEEFRSLATTPCHYCSEPPKIKYGIDRKDHRGHYTILNSVACCHKCNMKKGILERLGFTYPRTVELLKELLHEQRLL